MNRHAIGGYAFERTDYFVHVVYPGGRHTIAVEAFLDGLEREVASGLAAGTVNFDNVFGTVNRDGSVEMFIGLFNEAYRADNRHYVETFAATEVLPLFDGMLAAWRPDPGASA